MDAALDILPPVSGVDEKWKSDFDPSSITIGNNLEKEESTDEEEQTNEGSDSDPLILTGT